MADKIVQSLASISSLDRYSSNFIQYKNIIENNKLSLNEAYISNHDYDFSIQKMQVALANTKSTAEGPNRIHYQLLKNLPDIMMEILLKMYNKIWTECVFLMQRQEATVSPLLKPNKNLKEVSSYRSIGVTNCICKLMERMVNARLMWILETRAILNPMQYWFRKNRLCTDVLVRLKTEIRNAFITGKSLIAIFFDTEKTYDTTWRRGILENLHMHNIKGRLSKFLETIKWQNF